MVFPLLFSNFARPIRSAVNVSRANVDFHLMKARDGSLRTVYLRVSLLHNSTLFRSVISPHSPGNVVMHSSVSSELHWTKCLRNNSCLNLHVYRQRKVARQTCHLSVKFSLVIGQLLFLLVIMQSQREGSLCLECGTLAMVPTVC